MAKIETTQEYYDRNWLPEPEFYDIDAEAFTSFFDQTKIKGVWLNPAIMWVVAVIMGVVAGVLFVVILALVLWR